MAQREVMKIADEVLRPINQGLISIGSAVNFGEYVDREYIPGDLPLLASTTRACYEGAIRRHLKPSFGALCLRDLTPRTLKQFFPGMARDGVPYPTIVKVRDALSSILRSAVEDELLVKNPMEGMKLPPDKRPRRAKPFISPGQFNSLIELIPEPYATAVYVCVWTGLRVSELLGLKWRCIYPNSITIEERYCRGDSAAPKTEASAAPIAVEPHVIARIHRLKMLTVDVRAGRAMRHFNVLKADGPDDLVFQSVQQEADAGWKHPEAVHQACSSETGAACELAMLAHVACDLAGPGRRRSEIGPRPNTALAHLDHHGYLRSDRARGTAARG